MEYGFAVISSAEANQAMDRCDELLRNDPADERYINGLKDALGWILGHYSKPGVLEDETQ